MIIKYNDYMNESILMEALNEGVVNASLEFIKRLDSIKDKNKVAKELHEIFINEIEVNSELNQNYIDTSDKEDYITFLSDRRADNIDDEELYSDNGRSEMKVGRFARTFLNLPSIKGEISMELTDKDFEDFVNLYKSIFIKKEEKFEVVRGKKIKKYYSEDSYKYDKGQLGNSCMKYDSCQDYLDIYTKNKKVCNLLVYIDEKGKLLGRALVWKLDKSPSGAKYFMDRIYTSNDSDILKFIRYAEEQGWMYKYKQSGSTTDSYLFKYNGNIFLGEVSVKLEKSNFDEYPYLDTLYVLNKKEKKIFNKPFKGCFFIQDTSGDFYKCIECYGEGRISNFYGVEDCNDCKNHYKSSLMYIKNDDSYPSNIRKMAKEELKRL